MNTGQFCKRLQVFLGSTLLTISVVNSATAAPGTLEDVPLFAGSQSVKPNIMFLIDDSGSMAYGTLWNMGATNTPSNTSNVNYTEPDINDPNGVRKKLTLCAGYNVMAYNPKVTYKPWNGKDSEGNNYADFTLTTARLNPYLPADEMINTGGGQQATNLTDISDHVYYEWNDDGDGEYQNTECSSVKQRVDRLADEASKTNYANWFSYYRTRELAMKAAMSQIVNDSIYRMGFKTLNNTANLVNSNAVATAMDVPVSDLETQSNKDTMLDSIFQIDSDGYTPLRGRFNSIGEYFQGQQSPILGNLEGGQCQRNFAVIMSDGYWNTDTDDFTLTDQDDDGYDDTLADIAYLYYNTDLKTSIGNKVPMIPGVDEKTTQHLVTYTVAFGVRGTLTCNPATSTDPDCTWPEPTPGSQTTIDDMFHAAVNGHGKFLSASDPQALMNSFKSALTDISAMTGTLAPVTFNTTSLLSNSLVYQAEFETSGWRGDLTARLITSEGLNSTVQWSAAAKLKAKSFASRKLYTFDDTKKEKVDFTWANLTTAQKADLLVNTDGSTNYGTNIVNYLKGDHTNEGTGTGQFRPRNSQRLGDIVHSGPTFVGKPNAPYPDKIEGGNDGNVDKRYSTFVTAQKDRKALVYIGANDGALHAFNASSGEEEFAYIPNLLFSNEAGKGLHALAEPGYDHNYYVDLSATAADVYINDAWRTVIVGGLRGGGKGIFALDVTDADLNHKDDVLFEFTDVDLGYTYSEIQVAKMNNGEWAAIFGNGYNNNGDGEAKLFIVYLKSGTAKVLDTKVGKIGQINNVNDCDAIGSDCNGLSTPALADLNGDNIVDRMYAGDVHGNMWVFDVSSSNPVDWRSVYKDSSSNPTPLFIACRVTPDTSKAVIDACPAASRQPITSKPSLAWHPTQHSSTTEPNILVFFGTGQFLNSSDLANTDSQNFYGVWDKGEDQLEPADLHQHTIKEATYTGTNNNNSVSEVVRVIDAETPINYTTKKGWNIPLPTSKERVITNPTVYGDLIFFSTLIPGETQNTGTGNPCDGVDGGSGWLMAVKLDTGGEPDFATLDLNGDYIVTGDDALTGHQAIGTKTRGAVTESRFIGNQRVTPGDSRTVRVYDDILPPRSSWTVQ